jgi:hypothetical protein
MLQGKSMPKPRKPLSLAQILRAELAAVPSVNAVSKATGVNQPSLARFLRGETDSLSFESASTLLDYLGYTIVKRTAAKPSTAKASAAKPSAAKRQSKKRKPPKV